jgi:hypothetical protein
LKVVDGRDSFAGAITHYAKMDLLIGYHSERIKLYVMKLARYNIILGHTWLRRHNPHSDHGDGFICFNSNYCKEFCLPSNIYQEVVKTIGHLPPLYPAPQYFLFQRVNATAFDIFSKQHGVQIFLVFIGEINVLLVVFSKEVLIYEYGLIINKKSILAPGAIILNKPLDNNEEDHKEYYQTAASLFLAGILIENIRKILVPKVYINPKTKIPEYIYDLLPV